MGPRALVGSLCAANLIAGVAFGITFDRLVLTRHGPEHHGRRDRGERGDRHGPPGGGGREVERLTEQLRLDPAQADKVRAILVARRPLFAEAMKEVRPKLRALREETDAQIRAVLRPEQAVRMDELRHEFEQADRENTRDGGRSLAPPGSGTDVRPDASGAGK